MNSILEYLEKTCQKIPNKIAFVCGDDQISFENLRKKAICLGDKIDSETNHMRNKPICIIADRDINALVCMLGCLYSGNYYVLIDSNLPKDRIDKLIDSIDFIKVINCDNKIRNEKMKNILLDVQLEELCFNKDIEERIYEI